MLDMPAPRGWRIARSYARVLFCWAASHLALGPVSRSDDDPTSVKRRQLGILRVPTNQYPTDDLFITSEGITRPPGCSRWRPPPLDLGSFPTGSIHGPSRKSPFKVCPKVCPSGPVSKSDTYASTYRTGTSVKRNEDTEKTIWLTRKEAAEHMRLSPATLANWASLECGPEYVRIGRGRVLYQLADIEAWMQNQAKRAG